MNATDDIDTAIPSVRLLFLDIPDYIKTAKRRPMVEIISQPDSPIVFGQL